MRVRRRRTLAFVTVALATALSLVVVGADAQKRPHRTKGGKKAAAHATESADAGAIAPKEDRAPQVAGSKGAKDAGAVLEQKTLDGGARVFRFGEVEVEGRLKSPQIVYFLRRVRAEFAAGDLGHRSFMREMSETRSDPAFE